MNRWWKWLKWPGGIIIMLSAGVLMNIIMVIMAVNNPSWALEENYYEKGLNWDAKLKQDKLNRELGWKPELSLTLKDKTSMTATFCATLRGKKQEMITKAIVSLNAFANVRAGDRQKPQLKETKPGVYCAPLKLHRLGLWEFRLVVHRGKHRFTWKKMRSVPFTNVDK